MSPIIQQAYEHLPKKQVTQNPNVGGWSFLQALSETKGIVSLRNREDDDESSKKPYVHPIEKRSKAKLSFEMCTESLGTENGSESGDEISLLALEATIETPKILPLTTKPQEEEEESNSVTVSENRFPPPLNSVNGINRMVKSYGEDGRLVVQAIRVCSTPRCFVTERSEGRLRLCLSENSSLIRGDGNEEFEENESEFEHEDEDEDEEEAEEEEEEEEEEAEEDEEEEEEGVFGNNEKFEGKIGKEKFRRARRNWRCNENGCEAKSMLNWKQQQHFWVAT